MRRVFFGILATAFLSSCGIQKLTEQTRDLVGESNQKQGELLQKVRLQAFDQSCSHIAYPDSKLDQGTEFDRLAVFSGYGKECGKQATPDQLIEIAYMLLRSVTLPGPSTEVARTKFFALGTLAAYIPDDKFATILHDQIELQGRYYAEAHELAAIRFYFIQEFRLKPIYDQTGKPDVLCRFTIKQLEEAVTLYGQLAAIANSPYHDKFILEVNDHGICYDLVPSTKPGATETLDWVSSFKGLAGKIRDQFNGLATPEDRASADAQKLLSKLP